jgi:hypothetical protein
VWISKESAMRGSIGFALTALLLLSAPLSAPALTLVSQDRVVQAYASLSPSMGAPTVDSETLASPDFGPFDETAQAGVGFVGATGRQSSTITPLSGMQLQVDATGSSSASAFAMGPSSGFGTASASSNFEIVFEVDAEMPYDLWVHVSGSTLTDPFPASPYRDWSARVELLDGGGGVLAELARSSASGDPAGQVDVTEAFSGFLAPGTYTLRATTAGHASGDQYNPDFALAQSSFSLGFSIVPEPSAALLLGLGLAALARTRRRAAMLAR